MKFDGKRRIPGAARRLFAGAALLAFGLAARGSLAGEAIKIGTVRSTAPGPAYIALDKGYFAALGFDAQIVFFEAAQPVAVAVVSGDIDFGIVAPTGGLYSLGGQGAVRIIGGNVQEVPSFKLFGFLVADRAFDGGLRAIRDLPGHSVAVTQIGSGYHYSLVLLAEKYGVDLKSVRILPLQSIPNIASAITGAQADGAVLNAQAATPLIERKAARLIAWVGDETPYQATTIFTSSKIADQRHGTVERFLTAYRKGARAYHDAFTGPDEKRHDNATAPEMLAILSKFVEQPVEKIAPALAYADPEARLDVKDIKRQIAWYKAQGMIKGEVDADQLIDKRYVIPLTH